MKYGQAIYNILSNDTAVNSAVSGRIYPDRAEEDASFPYLVYNMIGDTPLNQKSGGAAVDLVSFQITALAKNFDDTEDITDKVRSALESQTGSFAGHDVAGITFDSAQNLFDEDAYVHLGTTDFTLFINN